MSAYNSGCNPTLEVKNLGLYQGGRWLFRGLNLRIKSGRFLALVGPSGVGKSSFLACLAGLSLPTEGEILYHTDTNGGQLPGAFRPHIGIIFQNFLLTENQTVLNNVLCGRLYQFSFLRTLFGFPRRLKQEAFEILYDLGLQRYCRRWVREISGGEKQRVALARTLFQNPALFLADEPVAQLDTYLTGRVLGILKHQSTEKQRTVVCVLHEQEWVNRFADAALSFNPEYPEKWNLRTINP